MSTFSNLGLSDLDAHVLTVRDRQSRQLIAEAIVAYRGGALRSALMSTWIAVAYDIFAKVRELSSQGERLPQEFIKELDSAIQSNNIKKQMKIEAQLLTKANKDFQLFAPHEYKALERLQRDRHLCAHPALVLDDEPYQPSPELVRAHIVHALQYLLIHAPLQGKSAIARFEADLLSASFPTTADDINSFLRTRYLDRAKDVLVVNLIKAVFSAPFGSEHATYAGKTGILSMVLHEIEDVKPEIYKSEMSSYVADKIEKTQDMVLLNICCFIKTDQRIWGWLLWFGQFLRSEMLCGVDLGTAFRALSARFSEGAGVATGVAAAGGCASPRHWRHVGPEPSGRQSVCGFQPRSFPA